MTDNWKDKWIDAVAPEESHKFARRFSWDGLTEKSFKEKLQLTPFLGTGSKTEFNEYLIECQKILYNNWDLPLRSVSPDDAQRPFEDLWWPIRCHALTLIQGKLKHLENIEPDVFEQLADILLDRLCNIGEQLLWEQFNLQRSPGMMLLAHLGEEGDGSGSPVRESYRKFIFQLRKDGFNELITKFPVFGRFIVSTIILWQHNSEEMICRISNDRIILEKQFNIPRNIALSKVKQGLSDPHRGGKAVAIIEFNSTTDCSHKLVYKPKDMGVDVAYQNALKDLNSCDPANPLRTLSIYNGQDYGYMEFVHHRLAKDQVELENFYYNSGRLTAILHLLGCTDCHHENLIACGDQLLLVDTETLLEADVPDHIDPEEEKVQETKQSLLQKRFQRSVLRSGLLPQWMFLGKAKVAVDISALGMAPPNQDKQQRSGWLGLNSDGMMPGLVTINSEVPTSLPVGVGQENVFQKYISNFCEGFSHQSQVLLSRRNNWLESDGILNKFIGLRRRIVIRATRVYFTIQRQQLEPSSLQSELQQSLKLEQLSRSYLLSENKPLNWPVFKSEVAQMQQLDIPFFTHSIDSDSLDLDEKLTPLHGFIATSGLSAARQRMINLDQQEIDFQIRLIRGACSARQIRKIDDTKATSTTSEIDTKFISTNRSEDLYKAAKRIFKCIENLAIRDENGQQEWLGMDLGADSQSFSFGPVGLSLYGGSIGIAVLLSRFSELDNSIFDNQLTESGILRPLKQLLSHTSDDMRIRWWRDQPLGISGCGGILLALSHIGKDEWVEELIQFSREKFIQTDQQLDFIGGCSGLIGPLLNHGSEHALDIAVQAGNHLLEQQNEDGSWPLLSLPRNVGLVGLSHGTSGTLAALAHLHKQTGEERFLSSAKLALAYERNLFDETVGNWPDLRDLTTAVDAKNFMTSWCHGAPGIGLSRLSICSTKLWDEYCIEELQHASKATYEMLKTNSGGTDHICCGTIGLIVALQEMISSTGLLSNDLMSAIEQVISNRINNVLSRCMSPELELRCFGTSEGSLMLPGFFTGLSGMAMGLLPDKRSRMITLSLMTAGLWDQKTF